MLLTNNLLNANAAGLHFGSPLTVVVPRLTPSHGQHLWTICQPNPGFRSARSSRRLPDGSASFDGKFVGTQPSFNYLPISGPNPSFAGLVPGGYGTQVALAHAAGYPAGFGVPVPFNRVDTQKSDASSYYNALTVSIEKQFSHHFQLLSAYTWSHSIDDGTDLQSTLEPADSRFPYFERGNSVNDQRHRWVTTGVIQSSPHKGGDSFMQNFLSN
jgi:hypothetical protein